jgi:oligopeptide transport system permease protein
MSELSKDYEKHVPILENDYDDSEFVFADRQQRFRDKTYAATSYLSDVWQNFRKNKGAVAGMIIIAVIILMAVIGPLISGYSYKEINIQYQNLPPKIRGLEWTGIFSGKINGVDKYAEKGFDDVCFWFGTDTQGRDLFTRVWEGTRISLIIAFAAVLIDMVIGLSYGLISGYFGGRTDMIMQRIAEVLNGIPTLVVVTLLQLVLPSGMTSIIFALMITGWIGMSRIARAEVLKLKESEFVLASRTLGEKHFAIIFKQILPNIFGQIIVMSMFSIPNAIFTEAFLSFIGLGIPAPMASLGSLISDGYKSFTVYPYMIAFPIVVLTLLVLSLNLFADGLRDAFDPNQRH